MVRIAFWLRQSRLYGVSGSVHRKENTTLRFLVKPKRCTFNVILNIGFCRKLLLQALSTVRATVSWTEWLGPIRIKQEISSNIYSRRLLDFIHYFQYAYSTWVFEYIQCRKFMNHENIHKMSPLYAEFFLNVSDVLKLVQITMHVYINTSCSIWRHWMISSMFCPWCNIPSM